jgi:hypothetical protein
VCQLQCLQVLHQQSTHTNQSNDHIIHCRAAMMTFQLTPTTPIGGRPAVPIGGIIVGVRPPCLCYNQPIHIMLGARYAMLQSLHAKANYQ